MSRGSEGKKYSWHPDAFIVEYNKKTFEVNLECTHDVLEKYGVKQSEVIFARYLNSYDYEITGSRPADDFMSGVVEYIYEGKGYTQKMHMLVTDENDEAYPEWIEMVNLEILAEIQRNICLDLDMATKGESWNCMYNLLTLHD